MPETTIAPGLPPVPDLAALQARYRELERALAASPHGWDGVVREWDGMRRDLRTYEALTNLRFDQDTADAQARRARETLDELKPQLTALDHAMKTRLARGETREAVAAALGPQAVRLWDADLAAFAPELQADLAREAKLIAEYTALLAGIAVPFGGERLNLAALARYALDPDRDVRHAAAAARWSALAEAGAELDAIFDRLVALRHAMARRLGYRSFVELGYLRRQRIGYGPTDVQRWRDAVVEHVVPLAAALIARSAPLLGVEQVALWDEKLLDGPEPFARLDVTRLLDRAIAGFTQLDPELGAFAALIERRGLHDLVTRDGKRAGAYCTFLASYDVPFVFENANGSRDDVKTLVHELGHAFQAYRSRALPLIDYVTPTYEAAEVHSMSLEFLSWPVMERFFGDDARRFRRAHLSEAVLFLPYGVAIDHFQHLVYERPEATPAERHAMWRAMEERYLPWRRYGDLERPALGAFWQQQLHVYRYPFYYVDYTLALCCALQFWSAAQDAHGETLARYVALCGRGGAHAFGELIASAGLRSPFDPGALPDVVARVRAALAV